MGDKSIAVLAEEVRRGLADVFEAAKDDEFSRALENVHERAAKGTARIRAAKRYRTALRAEGLDVGVMAPNEKKACETGRQALRRVATQLLSQEGKRTGLLTGEAIEQALGAATNAARVIVQRSKSALQAEQARLRPPGFDQPVPEVPGTHRLRTEMDRHRGKLIADVGVAFDNILSLAEGDEVRELRDLRIAAVRFAEVKAQILEGLKQQPAEVQRFIEAASRQEGAPLSMFTPAIRDWLAQAGATDNFVIRTSS